MDRTEVATRMARAAATWLDTLDRDQHHEAAWAFPADDERRLWFYTPTDHGGLPLCVMSPTQQRGALRLLRSGLSEAAYNTATTIIGLENTLDAREGFAGRSFGRERGRDAGLYYARVFGDPVPGGTWAWRFGGHHVSVNHTIVDGVLASSTPCFLGANPASAPLLGPHLLRPLAGAEDLGRELVRSLDDAQLGWALLSPVAPGDLVTTNRPHAGPDRPAPGYGLGRGEARDEAVEAQHSRLRLTAEPQGIRAADLSSAQRDLLRALLDVYVRRVPDELAEAEAAKFAGNTLDELAFGWAGSVLPGDPHYYRVQGRRLLAEYDNTQNEANHVHTVWRDLDNDFGGDPLALHYATSHHGPAGHDHHHGHGVGAHQHGAGEHQHG